MKNKGVSEIISQILLMLITVVVVGLITAVIVPQLTRSKSQIKFEESQKLIDDLYDSVEEVYNSPVGYIKEVSFSLDGMTLNIDGNTDTIEIYSLIEGNFYKDGLRQERGNGRYTYRQGQKLYAGFVLDNIDLVRSYTLENQQHVSIYLKKTDKDKITVLLENTVEDDWFSPAKSNLGLYEESPGVWQYRKKILIDHNKVDGNLTNFPVLIYLEDSDLNLYANSDGNDIIFTSKDGRTKLKREIESFETRAEYRKKIIIDKDKVDGNLTNFPVLISIIDENLASFAQSDGKDIYFTASDGTTRLKREIEDYNSTTGTLVAWVKVPELSSTIDTNIYLYFGNQDENNSNDKVVWDSNAALVMHFNDNALDSTIYTNNGTVYGSPEYVSGISSKAMYFDGNNDYINLGTKPINSPLQMREGIVTVSHWIKPEYNEDYNWVVLYLGSAGGGWRGYGTGIYRQYTLHAEVYGATGGRQHKFLANGTINIWKHLVVKFDGINNKIIFYVDGNKLQEFDITDPGDVNTTNNIYIGSHGWTEFYKGIIDELRVYNKGLSESWIKTEYNNQSSPGDFYTVGELEETSLEKELVAWVKVPELSSVDDTAIYMYFGNPSANESNDADVWSNEYLGVWNFNEATDTYVINSSGKSGPGTLYNATHTKDFNHRGAISLNSSTARITIPSFPELGRKWTLSSWIYIDQNKFNPNSGYNMFISMDRPYFGLYSSSRKPILSWTGSDLVQKGISTSTVLNFNTWYYLTGTHDGNTGRLYLNGTLINSVNADDISTPVGTLLLGAYTTYGQYSFPGEIASQRIYNSTKSPQWIKTEYNNQSSPEGFIKVGILEKQ